MSINKKTGKKYDTPTSQRFARRQRISRHTVKLRDLTARDVLDILLDSAIAKQTNEFVIEAARRKSIASTINSYKNEMLDPYEEPSAPLGDRSIKAALTKLVRHGFLVRTGRGKYKLNPDRYFIGDTHAQVAATVEPIGEAGIARKAA